MRLTTILLATALPASALAVPPYHPQSDDDRFETDDADDADDAPRVTDSFEWSTGQSRLGLMVMGLTPELRSFYGAPPDSGLLVAQVSPNSPAERAGIRVGDIITKLGTEDVETAGDILSAMDKVDSHNRVTVQIIRNRQPMTLQPILGSRKDSV
ncbi:MAG: PDZ domain-containing protein [Kofleriaceae bacterium]